MREPNEFGYRSFDSYRGRESNRGVHYSDHNYGAFGHHHNAGNEYGQQNERYDRHPESSHGQSMNRDYRGQQQADRWLEQGYSSRNRQPEYASGQNSRGNDSHNEYNDWIRQRESSDQYWNSGDNDHRHSGQVHRGGHAASEYSQRELWERQHRTGQREPGHRTDWADQASNYSRNHGWGDNHPKDWNTSPNRSYYDEF